MGKKIYSDTMILGSGHSMLVSHVPGIKLEPGIISDKFYEVSKKDQESVDKFGLIQIIILTILMLNQNNLIPEKRSS